jgi:23S rRNA G2445 N2-methylase RlmL
MTLSCPFFVRATQGLEDVVAAELRALPGVQIRSIGHRTVSGDVTGSPAALLALRSADDAFLEVARFDGMERARAALGLLSERAAAADLQPALAAIGALRPLSPKPALSISASFVGRRNYTTDELKEALAREVAGRRDLPVEPDDRRAPLHLRLVLEHGAALLGLRLGREPLHERRWKGEHVPGSLKPSVAAALWRLAGLAVGARALDVCCGAGTLVVEAADAGARALGGDRDVAALAAASANLRAFGAAANLPAFGAAAKPCDVGGAAHPGVSCAAPSLVRWDARALPLPGASIDAVASNLPWGRQVGSDAPLETLYAGIADELARVLAPRGTAVVLTGAPECFAARRLRLDARREIGLFGRRPSVLVLSRPAEAA